MGSLEKYMHENFDIEGLREMGFLKGCHETPEKVAERICKFFELDNIYEFSDMMKPKKPESVKASYDLFSIN